MEAASASGLTYRQRLSLRNEDPYGYARLYSSSLRNNVWSRLTGDAAYRRSRMPAASTMEAFFPEGYSDLGSLTGFISNTAKAVYTHTTFKSGHCAFDGEPPIETLHPITAKRYQQKYAMDFMAKCRPDTETCNQTLRMLGTYSTDHVHADRMGINIPSGCPGGPAWFHADVRLTSSLQPTSRSVKAVSR